jgi:hypothetical protein
MFYIIFLGMFLSHDVRNTSKLRLASSSNMETLNNLSFLFPDAVPSMVLN